jgi:hypothetical protein
MKIPWRSVLECSALVAAYIVVITIAIELRVI